MLKAFPAGTFDVRDVVPLVVGRESTIRYETNRYSVPPQYIGTTVQMLLHPLHRTVDVMGSEGLIRRFSLAAAGSHTTQFFPDDRAQLVVRWNRDQRRLQRLRSPHTKIIQPYVDVDIRSPAVYEALI